jgi:hypothetical protein
VLGAKRGLGLGAVIDDDGQLHGILLLRCRLALIIAATGFGRQMA